MGKKDNKKKKEKAVYIDDGSTIADMSGIGGKKSDRRTEQNKFNPNGIRPRATFKEQWKTYTDAVKMMFLPMLAVLGILAIAFLLVYLIL
ncbi:MAG: hypothetical protein J6L83_07510 [Clostridia bacterium]|nr:hypothetical protein [Clostridia bacterium]